MTTTDERTVGGHKPVPAATPEPSPSALRRSAAIRVGIAVLVAGGLTAAAISAVWTPSPPRSSVVAYPIFDDFNPYKYVYGYYLAVVLFPVAAVLLFVGLTWLGDRVGLAIPPSRGRLRPVPRVGEEDRSGDAWLSVRSYGRVGAVARVAVVGVVLGLEVGVASSQMWLSVALVGVGYLLVVALASVALRRLMSEWSSWEVALATINALGASLTVAGLSLVSAHTEVRVLSDGAVHHYAWFPVWLGVPLAALLFGWVIVSLRRTGPVASARIERRAVVLIAAPVAIFVLLAYLPGDLAYIGLFEQGQLATETMLLGHGWLPWRDVVVAHGLLGDIAPTAVGSGVFGDSYWGGIAGASLIFHPLAAIAVYWLLAYLLGRSWPLLVLAALMFVGPWVGAVDPRYILWPLILLVLAALLNRPTRVRAAGLGVGVVVLAIATPEIAPVGLIVGIVVAAYEWYWRAPGVPWAQAYRRTIWGAVAALASVAVFVIYMASRGALGDVVSVTFYLTTGHFTEGIPPIVGQTPSATFDFLALAPVVALLVSFAYVVARLRLRRPFLLADWPMAVVALFVLFYYSVFLARMDGGHVYEPFMVATPLMLYIVYRGVSAADVWVRRRLPTRWGGWVPANPFGIAVLIVFVLLFWGPLRTQVDSKPAAYRPVVPVPPVGRAGYASGYDSAAVDDLRQIFAAYLGPRGRVMDLTNEPGLFYYFLDREPASRWFAPVGLAVTPTLQRNLIADLRRSRPRLIVFDDVDGKMYGLEAIDGVPVSVELYLVSRWVLAHYRPLLESHNRTIYALPGVPTVSSLHLHLHQQPGTVGVPFRGQECNWGDAPSFLNGPAEPPPSAQSVPARTTTARGPQVTFTGWAGDLQAHQAAREVIATFNGRIVGRTTPDIARPDVPAAGYPSGFLRSGFRLSIPGWANARDALRVFAIGRDGATTELAIPNAPMHGSVASIGGRRVALQPKAETGHIDTESASGPLLAIEPPVGSNWSDYGWLEIDSPSFGGFLPGGFSLSDQLDTTDAGRVIAFQTVASSPRRYIIPVSSCAQWHGWGSARLFLTSSPPQEVGDVRLIR